ncbi:MAG: AAA family ATPase [Lysobacterales bacterium]
MYLEFYGLSEAPFSITPDPRFVYLSERHRDGLAHLLYGVGQGGTGGFVQLTGEVGTGKTTLCRLLLEQIPEQTRVALLLNPLLNPVELLETICEELQVDIAEARGSLKSLTDQLNAFLLKAHADGERVVVIIDEAQNLSVESLEQVRLLTNLETATQKLMQIILLGQPELRTLLDRPDLRQLAQRITARYHLTPLDVDETETYVRHRLHVAGSERIPFTRLALKALHKRSGGVPRLINVIADRAMVAGYARTLDSINERIVDEAADEALLGGARGRRRLGWLAAAAALLAFLALLWWWPRSPDHTTEAVAAVAPAAPSESPEQLLARLLAAAADNDARPWTGLAALWDWPADAEGIARLAACEGSVGPGLKCLRATGPLGRLGALGRPVVLRLRKPEGFVSALLLGMDDLRVRLLLAGETVELPRALIELHWLGDYRALWRAPDFLPQVLRQGDSGPAVVWLRERLALAEVQDGLGGQASTQEARFDGELERRLRRLQIRLGLVADGIAGPETQMALASYDVQGPRLARLETPRG